MSRSTYRCFCAEPIQRARGVRHWNEKGKIDRCLRFKFASKIPKQQRSTYTGAGRSNPPTRPAAVRELVRRVLVDGEPVEAVRP